MNALEVGMRETDIAYLELAQEIDLRSRLSVITESEKGGIGGLVDTIIKKIKEIFDNVKRRIEEYFAGENYEKSVNQLEANLRKNPMARDKKIKVKETGKVRSLFRETVEKIRKAKNVDEIEDAMNNYKKQRNILLAAGTGIVVTGAALLVMARKRSKEEIQRLDDENKKLISTIKKYKEKGYGSDIKDREAVDDGIRGVDTVTSVVLKKLSELAKEYSRDTLKEIAYNVHVIKEFNNLINENIE